MRKLFVFAFLVIVCLLLTTFSSRSVAQNEEAKFRQAEWEHRETYWEEKTAVPPHPYAKQAKDSRWYLPTEAAPAVRQARTPSDSGGPDDYGYTWSDDVPFNWIDATSGTNTGISGDDVTGLVNIGFPFKFYEQIWTEAYISTNGFLAFDNDRHGCCGGYSIPLSAPPNNIIAPWWQDLIIGTHSGSAIYTLNGGTAPNRFFVVEWYRATEFRNRAADRTFAIILHENGDIVMQYEDMIGPQGGILSTIGIEDSRGYDGLQYSNLALSREAIRFFRPLDPAAHVQAVPPYQGDFVGIGQVADFKTSIVNTGALGNDTYDLTVTSVWPVTLFARDGTTPLTDTDNDGLIDTGSLALGEEVEIVVSVTTPQNATVGDDNEVTLDIRSSLNNDVVDTVLLQTAVPAPFVQAYTDFNTSGGTEIQLIQPAGQQEIKAAPNHRGSDVAVVEAANGNLVHAWTWFRCNSDVCVREIEYQVINRYGEIVQPMQKLTSHAAATVNTYDYYPALAATSDGHIGITWSRYRYNSTTEQYNYNIYLAILDSSGNVLHSPHNITNNLIWGNFADLNIPNYFDPRISATGNNRFLLAWLDFEDQTGGTVADIHYAIRNNDGTSFTAIRQFTQDTPGYNDGYDDPTLTPLDNNRTLLAFGRWGDFDDIYYGVLDSNGDSVKGMTNLSLDGENRFDWQADAVQFSNGNVAIAWTSYISSNSREIRFAILDSNYNPIGSSTRLSHPAARTNDYVSITADNHGNAILSWMDSSQSFVRQNLYYALIDSSGGIVTSPMIFQSSQATFPTLTTSFEGHGNTTYSWIPPNGVDGTVAFTGTQFGAVPGGSAVVQLSYANHGAVQATAVTLTATLDSSLTYLSDSSGIAPTIEGNTLTWNLPNLSLLERDRFRLNMQLPSGASIGTRYPISLAISSSQTDVDSSNNSATAEIFAAEQSYLPILLKE